MPLASRQPPDFGSAEMPLSSPQVSLEVELGHPYSLNPFTLTETGLAFDPKK